MSVMRGLVAAIVIATTSAVAAPRTGVDWASGVVTAEGVGVADRHAPNPAVARGTSRRSAEDAARAVLRGKLDALPVAGGGTVGDKAKDKDIAARLDRAVAAAIAVAADPETDGAWRVTMAVPIEAVRQALDGVRALPAAGDAATPVVIVDGVGAKPAVGWSVGGRHAATVWTAKPPAWAADAKHVKATGAKDGAIAAELPAGAGDATVFVIVTP